MECEGGFVPVGFVNLYLLVCTVTVEDDEHRSDPEGIYTLVHSGNRIRVFTGELIQPTVAHAKAEGVIFFRDEDHRAAPLRTGGLDYSLVGHSSDLGFPNSSGSMLGPVRRLKYGLRLLLQINPCFAALMVPSFPDHISS